MLADSIAERVQLEELAWEGLSLRGEREFERCVEARTRETKAHRTQGKWYQRFFKKKKNKIAITASRWERDLTRECVESNPGPVQSKETMCILQSREYFGRDPKYGFAKRPYFNPFMEDKYMEDFDPTSFLGKLSDKIDLCAYDYHEITNLVEALLIFLWQYPKTTPGLDRAICMLNLVKHLDVNNSLLFSSLTQLMSFAFATDFQFELQSGDEESEKPKNWTEMFRKVLDSYEEVKQSTFVKKLYKFFMYALSLKLFKGIGLTMDTLQFNTLHQEAIQRKYYLGPDFIHCVFDTMVFLMERGQQYVRTGRLDSIFHDPGAYADWFDKTLELRRKSNFLSNPEPHGFTCFDYQADLRDTIEQGQAILSHAKVCDKFMAAKCSTILADMKLQLSNSISARSAARNRDSPFAICVSGGSGVGKSTFKDILQHHFAITHRLPLGDEYIHTKVFGEDFWPNFNSSKHTVILDDVAYLHPNKAPNGDPSMMDLIKINNKIAFCPPQAALEDKGKTPMRCKLLLATTNTPDLNARHYYSCPLAAQRRLPFVVDIAPKEIYSKHGVMMDGNKVALPLEGDYPDYWKIRVFRVSPHKNNKGTANQKAQLDVILETEDINDFIDWYTTTTLEFTRIQEQESECESGIKSITMCYTCYKIMSQCTCPLPDESAPFRVQASNRAERIWHDAWYLQHLSKSSDWCMQLMTNFWIAWCCRFSIFAGIHAWISEWFDTYAYMSDNFDDEDWKYMFRHFGKRVKKKIGYNDKYAKILKALAAVSGVSLLAYGLFRFFKDKKETKGDKESPQETTSEPPFDGENDTTHVQFKVIPGKIPEPREFERTNVWKRDNYELTTFDISPVTSSMKGLDFTTVVSSLERNVVKLDNTYELDGKFRHTCTNGICLGGHLYMFNNHGIPLHGDLTCTFIHDVESEGVTRNLTFKIVQDQIDRHPSRDLCFIRITNVPPKKNIIPLLGKTTLQGVHKGVYITREDNGAITKRNVANISRREKYVDDLATTFNMWLGRVTDPTNDGDCGSMMVLNTVAGPVIGGIHIVGARETGIVGALTVDPSFIDSVVDSQHMPIVQSGEPNLCTKSINKAVENLHHKSVMYYIREGTADVYGSLTGARGKPRSRVTPSLLCKNLLSRGYTLKHGKPVMSGYVPWRTAALDMVKPVAHIDQSLLDQCRGTFSSEILQNLPEGELNTVHVLDDVTTVNGCPGVAYIDKINDKTSMGFPWCTTKQHYVHHIPPTQGIDDPIEFDEEVMERMYSIIDKYHAGNRCMPVFSGHLKDEPTSFKKIECGKTRVFTGAPVDYSLVVRKYLLSVVRLIQNNRFVFESGPGTVAQSLEWQEIGNYLIQHGRHKIVAGDYKAFDKSMPASVILAAFEILYDICDAAGYSRDDLRVVAGIAEDTAFPLVNLNGDLVSFYGSNPSGHPLTVIINGLANSLYLRYCYAKLSPEANCVNFKRDIAVMTYGDDNIMGVSDSAPWFNHTTLQSALADIGIVYTMADKEAESVPYIDIDEASFLKRSWRKDDDIGAIVAPLEEASIEKMLMINVSKTSIPEKLAMSVIQSALHEYFWYGKAKFQAMRTMLQEIVEEEELSQYVEDSTFPHWDDLRDDFWNHSRHVVPDSWRA